MAHKTLIGGTAYEISGGKALVGGTAYNIEKGKTLIGGTAYGIEFVTTWRLRETISWSDAFGLFDKIESSGGFRYATKSILIPAKEVSELVLHIEEAWGDAHASYFEIGLGDVLNGIYYCPDEEFHYAEGEGISYTFTLTEEPSDEALAFLQVCCEQV